MTHKTGIAPLKDALGNLINTDLAKATILNEHFVNVGTLDNGIVPPFVTPVTVSSVTGQMPSIMLCLCCFF